MDKIRENRTVAPCPEFREPIEVLAHVRASLFPTSYIAFPRKYREFRTKSQNSCFKTRDFESGFSPGFPRGIPQNRSLAPILGNPEFSNSGIPGMEQGCNYV